MLKTIRSSEMDNNKAFHMTISINTVSLIVERIISKNL